MWTIPVILVAIILLLIFILLIYARWNYGILEKQGFPVVPPHFFLGSNPHGYKELAHIVDLQRVRKYGPIYGVYEGRQPKVFVSDPDLVKRILVKDYEYFSDRVKWELLYDKMVLEFVDFQLGENWKILRSRINKGLSIGRIKTMNQSSKSLIDNYIRDLVHSTNERTTVDLRDFASPLTIELCCLLFLGIQFDDRKNSDNRFIKVMKSLFVNSAPILPDYRQTIGYVFPFLGKLISPGPFAIPFVPEECIAEFIQITAEVLEAQRRKNQTGSDMIHVLLETMDRVQSEEYKKLGITEATVMAQIFEIFLSTYEGIPTFFATFFYHVAKCPESMKKLVEEVQRLCETKDGHPELDEIVKLPYLSACLMETFRILPLFNRLQRVCVKDWKDTELGIRIPKGMPVEISLWPMHHNPTYFPNPELFQPERFLPEAKNNLQPYAFGAFGHGPKGCPGNRLGQDILKMAIFEILLNFKVEPCPAYNMKQYPGFGLWVRTNPVLVDLIPKHMENSEN